MNIPTTLKYTKDHEWIRLEGDNAYIGITPGPQWGRSHNAPTRRDSPCTKVRNGQK